MTDCARNVLAGTPQSRSHGKATRSGAACSLQNLVGIRIAHHIQPMLRPTFSIVRRGQQSINCFGKSDLPSSDTRRIFSPRQDLAVGRSDPETRAAIRHPICLKRVFQIILLQFSANKVIIGLLLAGTATRFAGWNDQCFLSAAIAPGSKNNGQDEIRKIHFKMRDALGRVRAGQQGERAAF